MKLLSLVTACILVAGLAGPSHATKQIHAMAKVGDVNHEFHVDATNPNFTNAFLSRSKNGSQGEAYAHVQALPTTGSGTSITYCSWVWSSGSKKTLKSKASVPWCNFFCGSVSSGDGAHPCTSPHAPSGPPGETAFVIDTTNAGSISGTATTDTNLQITFDSGSALRIYTGGMLPAESSSSTLSLDLTNINTGATIATGTVVLVATGAGAPSLQKTGVFSGAPLSITTLGGNNYAVDLDPADLTIPGVTPSMIGDCALSVEAVRPDPETTTPTVPLSTPAATAASAGALALAGFALLRRRAV